MCIACSKIAITLYTFCDFYKISIRNILYVRSSGEGTFFRNICFKQHIYNVSDKNDIKDVIGTIDSIDDYIYLACLILLPLNTYISKKSR